VSLSLGQLGSAALACCTGVCATYKHASMQCNGHSWVVDARFLSTLTSVGAGSVSRACPRVGSCILAITDALRVIWIYLHDDCKLFVLVAYLFPLGSPGRTMMLMSLLSGMVCHLATYRLYGIMSAPSAFLVFACISLISQKLCPNPILPHRFQKSPSDFWQMVF
jgi:hypothetical protein